MLFSHMGPSWMNAMMEHVYPYEVHCYCWEFHKYTASSLTLKTLKETYSLFPRALSLSFNSMTDFSKEHWRLLLNPHLSGRLTISFSSLVTHTELIWLMAMFNLWSICHCLFLLYLWVSCFSWLSHTILSSDFPSVFLLLHFALTSLLSLNALCAYSLAPFSDVV